MFLFPDGFDPPTLCVSSTRDTTTPRKHVHKFSLQGFCFSQKQSFIFIIQACRCIIIWINGWRNFTPLCISNIFLTPSRIFAEDLPKTFNIYIHYLHVFCIENHILKHFLCKYTTQNILLCYKYDNYPWTIFN